MWSADDISWMRQALFLAKGGLGQVEPNPMVGCVLVQNGQLIGSGYHEIFGGDHAEVAAIRSATADVAGSTAFVTLEPCSHYGKTPPCIDALIAARVSRVVVALEDPFPQVAGQGIAALRRAGIDVSVGLLADEARDLNAPYFKKLQTGLPWVIAKWAMSLDGKTATANGQSKWISCDESRADAHRLRGRVDVIVAGVGTVLADDPLLTARPPGPRVAKRLVFDSQLRTPIKSRLAKSSRDVPTILVSAAGVPTDETFAERRRLLESAGAEIWDFPSGLGDAPRANQISFVLRRLAAEGATNVLVEGGGILLGEFARLDLVDEIIVYLAPIVIGGRQSPTPIGDPSITMLAGCPRWKLISQTQTGDDIRLNFRRGN